MTNEGLIIQLLRDIKTELEKINKTIALTSGASETEEVETVHYEDGISNTLEK